MQTTLLGLAIAAILALVAALVGPAYVDWGQYRSWFEAQASRMADQPVRIAGPIDVRLLPTPKIMLRDVELGPRASPVFGAQSVHAELSLEGLLKGEWRASALTLTGPEIGFALDADGKLLGRVRSARFDVDRVAIDRLVIEDGRITLEDAGSASSVTLDKLSFDGELRAQTVLIKGDGTFSANNRPFRYRVATGRRDAAMRVRLTLEPRDRPLTLETEGNVTFDGDSPVYEGTAAVTRPAGVVLDSGKTVANEPWRIFGQVKADVRHALFEQVEAQYGPDERRLRLTGTGELKFGVRPRMEGLLSARQLDLDRALAAANAPSRRPLSVVAGLVEALSGADGRPAVPISLGLGIDTLTLGGSSVQGLRADVRSLDGAWSVDTIEFRAPGSTQVNFSGQVGGSRSPGGVAGEISVESADPGALMAWLEGGDRPQGRIGSLWLRSRLDVTRDRLAFDNVRAEIDRKTFEGRLAYTYPASGRRAKLDVALNATEFDVDAAYSFVKTAMAGTRFEHPGDVALAVDLGRTSFAGVTATGAKAVLRYDAGGVRIQRLAVDDFGGAALSASGQIDIASPQPSGNIALNLMAPKIDGVAAAVEKLLPGAGNIMLRNAASLSPARLDAKFVLEPAAQPAASGSKPATARFSLDGRLGGMRLTASGDASGAVAEPENASVRLDLRVASDDGAMIPLLGLERFAPAERRPVELVLTASGPLRGDMRLDARIASAGFELAGAGALKLSDWVPVGTLNVSFASSDAVALRRAGTSAFPVTLKSALGVADGALTFAGLDGKAGGAAFKGQLVVSASRKPPWQIGGRIAAESLDVPAVVTAILGAPAPLAAAAPPANASNSARISWPSQPFVPSLYTDLRGRVDVEAAQAVVLPGITAEKLRGSVSFGGTGIGFDQVTATVGGGKAAGNAKFEAGSSGITARGNLALTSADARAIIRGSGNPPVTGRLSGELVFESTGSSPAALIAGLRGGGLVSLDDGRIAGIDVKAVDNVASAAERGAAMTPQRVTEMISRALDSGTLSVSTASFPVELSNGRARLGKPVAQSAPGVALTGSLDLVEEAVDLRFTMLGSGATDSQGLRPELIVTYKGPVTAPRRAIDIAALNSWLTLQSVERESKKLEEEEREAKRRAALEALIREATRDVQPPAATGAPSPAAATPPVTPSAGEGTAVPAAPERTPPKPVSSLAAPELPAPQLVPPAAKPPVEAAPPASEPVAAASADQSTSGAAALPVNPPLPQRRPPPHVQPPAPVELAPPVRRGSIFDFFLSPR